jgi:hypothetical protein
MGAKQSDSKEASDHKSTHVSLLLYAREVTRAIADGRHDRARSLSDAVEELRLVGRRTYASRAHCSTRASRAISGVLHCLKTCRWEEYWYHSRLSSCLWLVPRMPMYRDARPVQARSVLYTWATSVIALGQLPDKRTARAIGRPSKTPENQNRFIPTPAVRPQATASVQDEVASAAGPAAYRP